MRLSPWPILYEDLLRVGDLESSAGVCTLWTKRDTVRDQLDPHSYCVVGNLYRSAGISAIIRNVWANPHLRTIALWGTDLSDSGDAFMAFMRHGINAQHEIIGARGKIEKEIDHEAVELFRRSVQAVDLRGQSIERLKELLAATPRQPPFAEPRTFPIAEPDVRSWPAEISGFRVQGPTVAQTWLKVLRTIMRYGRVKTTRYGNTKELKEILNLVAIVESEDPDDIYYPEYLPMGRDQLEAYYPQVLEARPIEGTSYTYGMRLRNYEGIDQIQAMIDLIRARPDSKKMLASTWNVAIDSKAAMKGDSPCLTQINGSVHEGTFYLTAHFRSQDMFNGWPSNMFAVRKLQKQIAEATGLALGWTTMITHSAHLYAWSWDSAEEIIQNWYKDAEPKGGLELDRRGYFIITTNGGRITATFYSPDHDELYSVDDVSGRRLYLKLAQAELSLQPSHLLYLGYEIHKAETALKLGIPYVQDRALDLTPEREGTI